MQRISSLSALAAAVLLLGACGDGATSSSAPRGSDDVAIVGAPSFQQADPSAPRSGPDGVRVFRFRSVEDPNFPADRAVCDQAGFATNVFLGASLWSEAANASEGRIVNESVRRIGRATACVRITNPAFPPGLPQDFYVRFDLAEGAYVARGACTLISNDVPVRGLVLGGCHLRLVEAPSWVAGGAVTSLSVFNPARLPGFATGSEWTLQAYDR